MKIQYPIRVPRIRNQQEAQLMLTNTRDAFRGQSRSPNSSIPYVRHSFLLCNSNFVFKTRSFYDSRLIKCRDLEIGVRGHHDHWKRYTILYTGYGFLLVFYRNFVPNMHRFFEIFAFSNTVTLKSESKVTQGRKGHHLIERIWLPIDILL